MKPILKSAQRKPAKRKVTLDRVDVAAIAFMWLAILLTAVSVLVLGLTELAKLICNLCADAIARWTIIVCGLASLWILLRRKLSPLFSGPWLAPRTTMNLHD